MRFSHIKQITALMAVAFSRHYARADNSMLQVLEGDDCVDLVTGTDSIVIGTVCTEVTGDNVVVTFDMLVQDDCCIKETHICNMPPMIADIEAGGCMKSKVVSFSIMDVFGFMCSEECDTFQFNGHATVICDTPLKGDTDGVPGDPLPDGAGQGNYGDDIYCYGAMYDVGLKCGTCANLCPAFECQVPATPCGEAIAANRVDCFCSCTSENLPPNEELEEFCWQDIGCFVPLFYLTRNVGSYCESSDDCYPGTACVPNTCCGGAVCLPGCTPEFGDKNEYTVGDIVIPAQAMVCEPPCEFASGRNKKIDYDEF